MKQKWIFGLLILSALLCAAYNFSYQKEISDPPPARQQTEEPAAAASAGKPSSIKMYYLVAEDGCVSVYLDDTTTLYEYTTIRLDSLPDTLREEIQNGKFVEGDRELYNFLENYSS